jgi:hypothetical protein
VPQPALLVSCLILLVLSLFALRRSLRVARLIRQLRTLRPTSIAEAQEDTLQVVKGRIASPATIPSAFRRHPVAYYAFRVEEPRPAPQKPRRLAVGKDWAAIELEDETGTATVEARPALIRAPHEHIATLGKLDKVPPEHAEFFEQAGIYERHLARFVSVRVVEYTLEPGDEVYVLGTVRSENGRKIFYRATHSPLAVSETVDAGLVPGYRNELLLFSVAAALLCAFSAVFLVVSFA